MKIKKFHQFVTLEKGPINTAIVDLLKGNIYQVCNEVIENFLAGKYHEIMDFIVDSENEELCIDVSSDDWIPYITFDEIKEDLFHLQCEEGIDVKKVLDLFIGYKILIFLYNSKNCNFNECLDLIKCAGEFRKIDEENYHFNHSYNSCWGKKITILKDGTAKPCFHSRISLGNIFSDDVNMIVERAREYWVITKDKVEKCKDCELRYVCFDCREIPMREGGDIYSPNPFCKYDPYKGNWE